MIELLKEVFGKELEKILEAEKKDGFYLNAESFESCRHRAAAGIDQAMQQVIKVAALKIAEHREKEHGDDVDAEVSQLIDETDEEYLALASETADYWLM